MKLDKCNSWLKTSPSAQALLMFLVWGWHISGHQSEQQHRTEMLISMTVDLNQRQDWLTSAWWCHQMETFSMLLVLCEENPPVTGEFPSQRLVTQSFDVFFDMCLNKWLSKQSIRWWANNRDAGDLKCHSAHHYVTVMAQTSLKALTHWPLGDLNKILDE